jgi:hypothetical protein
VSRLSERYSFSSILVRSGFLSHYVARLMERPGLDVTALAGQAGVPEAGLRTVFGGAMPGQAQLRLLAQAFGMHNADLLAIAWADLPEDLAPPDPRLLAASAPGRARRAASARAGP